MHEHVKEIVDNALPSEADEYIARVIIDTLWPETYEFYHLAPKIIVKAREYLYFLEFGGLYDT